FGFGSPVPARGAMIVRLRAIALRAVPAATLSVGRCGGGTSVNAIAEQAWLELDLRSEDAGCLRRLETEAREALEAAVREENVGRRAGTAPLTLEVELIGDRPSGALPPRHALVRAAVRATRQLGLRP